MFSKDTAKRILKSVVRTERTVTNPGAFGVNQVYMPNIQGDWLVEVMFDSELSILPIGRLVQVTSADPVTYAPIYTTSPTSETVESLCYLITNGNAVVGDIVKCHFVFMYQDGDDETTRVPVMFAAPVDGENWDFWFAELTYVSDTTTTPGVGEVDGDQKAYSWIERIQANVGGVWKDGEREGELNAYLAEPSAGAIVEALPIGTLVLMRESPDYLDSYEFIPVSSRITIANTLVGATGDEPFVPAVVLGDFDIVYPWLRYVLPGVGDDPDKLPALDLGGIKLNSILSRNAQFDEDYFTVTGTDADKDDPNSVVDITLKTSYLIDVVSNVCPIKKWLSIELTGSTLETLVATPVLNDTEVPNSVEIMTGITVQFTETSGVPGTLGLTYCAEDPPACCEECECTCESYPTLVVGDNVFTSQALTEVDQETCSLYLLTVQRLFCMELGKSYSFELVDGTDAGFVGPCVYCASTDNFATLRIRDGTDCVAGTDLGIDQELPCDDVEFLLPDLAVTPIEPEVNCQKVIVEFSIIWGSLNAGLTPSVGFTIRITELP